MKRTIALLLALVMVLSLAACGGTVAPEPTPEPTPDPTPEPTPEPTLTKEEMLEVAEDGDISELNSLIAENLLRAKQAYCGKVIKIKDQIDEIKEDRIIFNHGMGSLIVYLPAEDIINLKKGQYITVVGLTNAELVTTKESRWGSPAFDYTDCIMEQAYLVTD